MILMTAAPGTGKSTAIQKIISLIGKDRCGGVYAGEIAENGERTGFKITTLDGKEGVLSSIYSSSPLRVAEFGVNLEEFESICLPALKDALENKEVLIIDEIGPMQMYSKAYQDMLIQIAESGKTAVGTIYQGPYPWIDEFKKHKNVELIELSLENRDWLPAHIVKTMKEAKERQGESFEIDSEFNEKIQKSKRYCTELDRFTLDEFTVTMHSEHDVRTIHYDKIKGYSCTCDFYSRKNTCSHIMAIERIRKEKGI